MTLEKLLAKIEEQIPVSWALDWDNVGLLVGDSSAEIKKVYIALDATDEVVAHAIEFGADLLLTHHPLIFSGMKRIVASDIIGRRILMLAQNNINYYAMHTNFDVAVMGRLAAEPYGFEEYMPLETTQIVSDDRGFGDAFGIGAIGDLEEPQTLGELAQLTKEAFGLSSVKIFGDADMECECIAIVPGSGKSDVGIAVESGADVLITGDIDHHTGIDAVAQGMAIIDAGHYGIEHIYIEYMKALLGEIAPQLKVATEEKQEPFWVV